MFIYIFITGIQFVFLTVPALFPSNQIYSLWKTMLVSCTPLGLLFIIIMSFFNKKETSIGTLLQNWLFVDKKNK